MSSLPVASAAFRAPTSCAPPSYPHIEAARIKGDCASRFEPVRQVLESLLTAGDDVGASIAIFVDGEPVVDLWGGYFDAGFVRPWDRDTIIATHSVTKTMTAMAALVLADQGELDLDARVGKYWPEFSCNGKGEILVRHLLGHTSGVAGWNADVTWEDVYDLERSCALLAQQEPWWEPGSASGYHGINQGHLVHGVVQRITGLTLGQYFAEHVAGPLGADYRIGTGPECDHRVASFVQATPRFLPKGNAIAERVGLYPLLTPQTSSNLAWRRSEVGAANGHGNARAVATIHSALACGGANGVRLLSDATRHRVLECQADGVDLLLGVPIRWGMGFALKCVILHNPLGHRIAAWGGMGGALAFVDFDERMSVSYVMNRYIDGPFETARFNRVLEAVYDSLEA